MSQEGVRGEGEGTWAFCADCLPQSSLGRGFRCSHWVRGCLCPRLAMRPAPQIGEGLHGLRGSVRASWGGGGCWNSGRSGRDGGQRVIKEEDAPQSCAEIPSELRGNSAINPEFPLPFGRVEGGWPRGEGIGSR